MLDRIKICIFIVDCYAEIIFCDIAKSRLIVCKSNRHIFMVTISLNADRYTYQTNYFTAVNINIISILNSCITGYKACNITT